MNIISRDEMVKALHEGVVKVTFNKKDGTERVMLATLNEGLIDSEKLPKGTGRETPEHLIRAFDTELREFRSITVGNVTSFVP